MTGCPSLEERLGGKNRRSLHYASLRFSYFAVLATTTCAALRRESPMQFINATVLDRKSGVA
jgi:hypothetical protein